MLKDYLKFSHKLIQLEAKRNLNLSNCFIFTILVHILRRDYEEYIEF